MYRIVEGFKLCCGGVRVSQVSGGFGFQGQGSLQPLLGPREKGS